MESPVASRTADDFERRFRTHALITDRRHAALITALSVPPGVIFVVNDYSLFGWTASFFLIASMRLLYATIGIGIAYRLASARTAREYDVLLAVWLGFLILMLLGLNASRPSGYVGSLLIEVVAIVFLYTAVRLPLNLQLTGAGVLTAGSVLLNLFLERPSSFADVTAALVAYVLANVLGFLAASQIEQQRRDSFELLENEITLRLSLEGALDEVRRLRGILPICATCKRIRDERGAWHQVESYIRERSEADFSHGLCPTCAGEYAS